MRMGACTDSMVAFALFLSHLGGDSCRNGSIGTGMDTSKGSHNGCNHQDNRATVLRSPDWLRRAMDSTIAVICEVSAARGVNEISLLNFVLADGRTLVASCHVRAPCGPGTGRTAAERSQIGAASLYYACGSKFCPDTERPASTDAVTGTGCGGGRAVISPPSGITDGTSAYRMQVRTALRSAPCSLRIIARCEFRNFGTPLHCYRHDY